MVLRQRFSSTSEAEGFFYCEHGIKYELLVQYLDISRHASFKTESMAGNYRNFLQFSSGTLDDYSNLTSSHLVVGNNSSVCEECYSCCRNGSNCRCVVFPQLKKKTRNRDKVFNLKPNLKLYFLPVIRLLGLIGHLPKSFLLLSYSRELLSSL